MGFATGAGRVLSFAPETTFGTKPATSAGKILPRVEHSLGLSINVINSKEIRPDLQRAAGVNGMRKVEGDLKGELAAGQFAYFLAAALRGTWTSTKVAPLAAKTSTPESEKQANTSYVPASGHSAPSFTFEDWLSDVPLCSTYTGCRVSSIDLDIKPDDIIDITVKFMGQDASDGAARYFTAPTPITQSAKLTGVSKGSKLMLNGAAVAVVTGAKITINCNASTGGVVGSNVTPDVFLGAIEVSGDLSCYMTDTAMRTAAQSGALMSLALRFDATEDVDSDYICLVLPAIKIEMPNMKDGEGALMQDCKFTASPAVWGTFPATTMIIQDTLA